MEIQPDPRSGGETHPLPPQRRNTLRFFPTSSSLSYGPHLEKQPGRDLAAIAGLIAVTVVMAFVLNLIAFSSLGTTGMIVGLVMAFSPVPLYMLLYIWLDRFDPEPVWVLAAAFGWGAVFSLLISFVVNTVFGTILGSMVAGPAGPLIPAIVSAPVIEEASKGSGLLVAMIFLRREFDGVLDGVVYGGVIALGFATGENVLYYGKTFLESGIGGLLMIGFLRGVLSPFAHSMFTSLTGMGFGIARESSDKAVQVVMPLAGFFAAVLLHALWNALAGSMEDMFIVAYFIVWVPVFLLFLGILMMLARRERQILRSMLIPEVDNGSIRTTDLQIICSTRQRFVWILSSIGNPERFRARRKYLRALSKLGLCHWHVSKADHDQTLSLPLIPRLRAQVLELRPLIK